MAAHLAASRVRLLRVYEELPAQAAYTSTTQQRG
jgi:hypothetical protein